MSNTTKPLVTIGIPTYNRAHLLAKTLECFQHQTYSNLEIFVSDNHSPTLETQDLVESLSQDDPRIRFVRQPTNLGALPNFNYVLKHARGKYFCWAADDDRCSSDYIEHLVSCLENHDDVVGCATDVRVVDAAGNLNRIEELESIRLGVDWEEARRLFFRFPTTNIFLSIYGMFRTRVLHENEIFYQRPWKDLVSHSEVPFLAKLATTGRIVSLPLALKTYVIHNQSGYLQEIQNLSRFDRIILNGGVRLSLLHSALGADIPLSSQLGLFNQIANSFRIRLQDALWRKLGIFQDNPKVTD